MGKLPIQFPRTRCPGKNQNGRANRQTDGGLQIRSPDSLCNVGHDTCFKPGPSGTGATGEERQPTPPPELWADILGIPEEERKSKLLELQRAAQQRQLEIKQAAEIKEEKPPVEQYNNPPRKIMDPPKKRKSFSFNEDFFATAEAKPQPEPMKEVSKSPVKEEIDDDDDSSLDLPLKKKKKKKEVNPPLILPPLRSLRIELKALQQLEVKPEQNDEDSVDDDDDDDEEVLPKKKRKTRESKLSRGEGAEKKKKGTKEGKKKQGRKKKKEKA
ncbi:hypothetical protein EVAR_15943_1 [Eumeta japonica]|uniref:Uncharacterized protein n=1 Tax=Eumeta variegata TaxID=151549 RepID=A0A4C1ULX5_EUMVA|nr:hypothetical protein EVAR_15943_1 [Eumeta japonica]